MAKTLAQLGGPITNPLGSGRSVTTGLPRLISNLITLAIVVGGLLVLFNFVLAGYDFLTASGDPKKVQTAVTKMWQSVLGLLIIVASLALVSIIGQVIGVNLLQPKIVGP